MTALMWFVGLPCFLWLCVQLYRVMRGPKRNRRDRLGRPFEDPREWSKKYMDSMRR
jgi:hypothetical protein